jgi:hypothetical protein
MYRLNFAMITLILNEEGAKSMKKLDLYQPDKL